jgi:hypothetical protein
MFRRLSKKLDEISCRILLGQTAKRRARQLQESSPTLSEKEAEQSASREAVDSIRSGGIDATSYSEVRAWSKEFLARTPKEPKTIPEGFLDPVHCDFAMVADELRGMLRMTEHEAATKGEEVYYKPEFLEALYPFIEAPSTSTATRLLEVAPFLRSYFEKCSPGGEFYEMKRFLGGP